MAENKTPTSTSTSTANGKSPPANADVSDLKPIIADMLGRHSIEFGVMDASQPALIIVLPPKPHPQNDMNRAMPERFTLKKDDKSCWVISETTGEKRKIDERFCVPI